LAWKRLCAADTVAEDQLHKVEIDGIVVLVTRVAGDFSAFPPLCPHMAEPLDTSGFCAEGVLTCTKHLWQWDLRDGSPQGAAEKPLLLYAVKRRGTELWIDLDGELGYGHDQ
jgi:toluene monooxygenase system ferredoxin subunit